jgi:excisionase family DNA binding protein
MNSADICTVSEAADEAGKSKRTILRRVRDGTLDAEKKGGVWLIQRESLSAYLDRNCTAVPA